MKIESLKNDRVKKWVRLKDKKERDKTGTFLVEGDHLVTEAKKKGLVLEIITTEDKQDSRIPTFTVTKEIMKKISDQVSPSSVVAVCKKQEEIFTPGPVLCLDDIQDPGNLGTIIRSAVAFGFKEIVLSEHTVDVYNPKVIRSTEGMLLHVKIFRKNLEEFLKSIQDEYVIFGTDVKDGILVEESVFPPQYALIIGSEGTGMNKNIRALCDKFFYIPMDSNCESLNAGVSASILMYEINKRSTYE